MEKDCSICLDVMKKEEICKPESCNHEFCSKCLIEWIKTKSSCPLCRKKCFSIIFKESKEKVSVEKKFTIIEEDTLDLILLYFEL